jgi:molybdopterin/thiamine biosynthesis adenylyltransferase
MEAKKLLVIGVGALGSAFLGNLRGQFENVGIFDGDIVSAENMSTQPFYNGCKTDIPVSKAVFAAGKLAQSNKQTNYTIYNKYFTEDDFDVIKEYDFIADFTDNIKSRQVINKGCVKYGKPAVFASINDRELSLYFYSNGKACFNCILRKATGKIKEGCESMLSAPSPDTVNFIMHEVSNFLQDKDDGGNMVLFSLFNGRRLEAYIKKDAGCEECSLHSLDIEDSTLIQACSSGIKISLHRKLDLGLLKNRVVSSKLIDDYLMYREGRKSFLISGDGDFLFTGYSLPEAKELLSSLLKSKP